MWLHFKQSTSECHSNPTEQVSSSTFADKDIEAQKDEWFL